MPEVKSVRTLTFVLIFLWKLDMSPYTEAYNPEHFTALYLCHGVFTNQFFLSHFPQIQSPKESLLANHKLRA